jgi:hypothetical protein
MIAIKSINYITTDDVKKLTGKHWGDFEFAQMAENDSYQILDCSDDRLEDLKDDFEDAEEPSIEDYDDEEEYNWRKERCYWARLRNEINLIEILRNEYNIHDTILVWISW